MCFPIRCQKKEEETVLDLFLQDILQKRQYLLNTDATYASNPYVLSDTLMKVLISGLPIDLGI